MWRCVTANKPSGVTGVSPSLCQPAAPSGPVLSPRTTCCSEFYVWTLGGKASNCVEEMKDIFLLFPFFSLFLPFALLEGHNTLESYQEFTSEGIVIIQGYIPSCPEAPTLPIWRGWGLQPGDRSRRRQKGNRTDPEKGRRGCRKGRSPGGECRWWTRSAEESRSGSTFVLPIWWGCNYRRIELMRHGGPFPLTFASFLHNHLWEKR